MSEVNATKFKTNLGSFLEEAIKEPVIVTKSGRPSAVLISFETFERLSEYEDQHWLALANAARKEGFLGVKETQKRLDKYAKRAGISSDEEETS
jgi:prevent-host-death family protein